MSILMEAATFVGAFVIALAVIIPWIIGVGVIVSVFE